MWSAKGPKTIHSGKLFSFFHNFIPIFYSGGDHRWGSRQTNRRAPASRGHHRARDGRCPGSSGQPGCPGPVGRHLALPNLQTGPCPIPGDYIDFKIKGSCNLLLLLAQSSCLYMHTCVLPPTDYAYARWAPFWGTLIQDATYRIPGKASCNLTLDQIFDLPFSFLKSWYRSNIQINA